MPQIHIRSDKKGELIEIFKGKFAQANLLIMKKGSVWGKHYHKKTREYFYVLRGKLYVSFFKVKKAEKSEKIFRGGDSFILEPHTFHKVHVLEPTECFVLYSRQFTKKDPDIYR